MLELKPSLPGKSRFEQFVELADRAGGSAETAASPAQERAADTPVETRFEQGLNRIAAHLRSFFLYFLKAAAESRLERDLAALRGDDPRRAGESKASFVWVIPDFADLTQSLPREYLLRSKTPELLERGLELINRPYRTFFRELEVKYLEGHRSAISNYWRTRGQANRDDWIYASFDDPRPDGRLTVVPRNAMSVWASEPRPQHMFLRVRICDSLNEPYINGLFVFTTDHDEGEFKHKDPRLRREDVEDLLSFGKVFFFAVRDHLHGLDRARDTSDIGRLNQHLYDRRLSILEQRMGNLMKLPDLRDITDPQGWSHFMYDVINNYAYSLIDKPLNVRIETFPFDRLLLIPLSDSAGSASELDLPFYLFQALYFERVEGTVDGGHYSLLKPFQSPVELVEAPSGNRFEAKTFQQVSEGGEGRTPLARFLEKCYVGATGSEYSPDELASYVPRSVPLDAHPKCSDRGKNWSESALSEFWRTKKSKVELWRQFLRDLTQSYMALRRRKARPPTPRRDSCGSGFAWAFFALYSDVSPVTTPT